MGRVTSLVTPGVELAITVHVGNHSDIDRAYGSLATHVADHALAVEGPIREYYVVGPNETPDESLWSAEIGRPIFHRGEPPGRNLRRP
jgi:effector-binding domain-containing protein